MNVTLSKFNFNYQQNYFYNNESTYNNKSQFLGKNISKSHINRNLLWRYKTFCTIEPQLSLKHKEKAYLRVFLRDTRNIVKKKIQCANVISQHRYTWYNGDSRINLHNTRRILEFKNQWRKKGLRDEVIPILSFILFRKTVANRL